MGLHDNKIFGVLEFIINLLILNLFWLISCLPLITVVPATSAIFSVVRQWKLHKDTSVVRLYFKYFKENFKQSFGIGIIWSVSLMILFLNFFYLSQEQTFLRIYIRIPLTLLSFLFIVMSTHLFSIMAHYALNWKETIKLSFMMSIGHLTMTFLLLTIVLILGLIFIYFPISMLIIFSLGAYIIFSLCYSIYSKLETFNE